MAAETEIEPGAARYGNFPDYYKFNPAEERMDYVSKLSRSDFSVLECETELVSLDIGCNSGDLTHSLFVWLKQIFPEKNVRILGLDVDEGLVTRATSKYRDDGLQFRRFDMMADNIADLPNRCLTFCFSVTLWVHINHGDGGLRRFLSTLSHTQYLLMETQPWRCYRTAQRRAKRAGQPPFPLYDSLKIRNKVTEVIDEYLHDECQMKKIKVLGTTNWDRNIILYENLRTRT